MINKLNLADIQNYIHENIKYYYISQTSTLDKINIKHLIKRKNPYMFLMNGYNSPSEYIKNALDSYIHHSDETLFGEWVEKLAIHINHLVYGGIKSKLPEVDLEFTDPINNIDYYVSIKSGPYWANSSHTKKMVETFNELNRVHSTNIKLFVNGCIYGHELTPDKGTHLKYCGEQFWRLISNDYDNLYVTILDIINSESYQKDIYFNSQYNLIYNKLLSEFIFKFGDVIDPAKLMEFISGEPI